MSGGEVALVDALERPEAELRAVTLGANGRDLLVETPHHGLSPSFEDLLAGVAARHFRVVLAHPEISRDLQRDPERLGRIAGAGALVQVTASALGAPRSRAGRLAWHAIGEGWVHVLASDAHSPSWRPPTLAVALDAARAVHPEAAATLDWMVTEAPRAILAGEPLPPRPPLRAQAAVSLAEARVSAASELDVAAVIDSMTWGGAETLLADMAVTLGAVGVRLSVIYLTDVHGTAAVAALRERGVEPLLVEMTRLHDPRGILRLRAELARRRTHLVHTHLGYADLLGGVAARSLRVPSVSTLHLGAWPRRGKEGVKERAFAVARRRCARRVVAVSDAARAAYLATGWDDPARVVTIHNGIARAATR